MAKRKTEATTTTTTEAPAKPRNKHGDMEVEVVGVVNTKDVKFTDRRKGSKKYQEVLDKALAMEGPGTLIVAVKGDFKAVKVYRSRLATAFKQAGYGEKFIIRTVETEDGSPAVGIQSGVNRTRPYKKRETPIVAAPVEAEPIVESDVD